MKSSERLGAGTREGASMSSSSVSLCSGIHSIQSVFVISRYFQHFIFDIYSTFIGPTAAPVNIHKLE